MIDQACATLADRFAQKRDNGLVDIKFYVQRGAAASPAVVCEEVSTIFRAIADGATEPFAFDDRHAAAAVA